MNKNIEVLQEVLDLLEEEKRKFYNLVNQNDFRIEEINSYLRELSKDEEDDFKVFSPRNAENRHREQIESDTVEKEKCEKKNVEYKKKIEYLKLLSDKVYSVIHNLQIEDETENIINREAENSIENFDDKKSKDMGIYDSDAENVKLKDMNADDSDAENVKLKDTDVDGSDAEKVKSKDTNTEEELDMENSIDVENAHLAHQILNCVSFIIPDPERARVELTAIAGKLKGQLT